MNGAARNYFNDIVTTEQKMSSTTVSTNSSVASGTKGHDYWPNDLYTTIKTDKKATKTTLSSISISKAEQEYVCVPAHSFKIFNNLSVSPNLLITCIKNDDYPKAIKPVGNYEESNSPLNPNRSLESKTIPFYCRADWLSPLSMA